MKMPPTKLLIFGNPKGGTPLMLVAPSTVIDLPLRSAGRSRSCGRGRRLAFRLMRRTSFTNLSPQPVKLLCFCSPPGLEEFFLEIGVPVKSRTTPPPTLEGAAQAEMIAKIRVAAPRYRTELLPHA